MAITVVSLQESKLCALCFNTSNVKFIKIIFKDSVLVLQKTDPALGWPTVAQTPTHNTGIPLPYNEDISSDLAVRLQLNIKLSRYVTLFVRYSLLYPVRILAAF
jgi:hypothetical protein